MSAVNVYLKKTVERKEVYSKAIEVAEKVATGEIGIHPFTNKWERNWKPFGSAVKVLESIGGVGRSLVIAYVEKAKKYLMRKLPNRALAEVYRNAAIQECIRLGNPNDLCTRVVDEAIGWVGGGGGGGGGGGVGVPAG